MNTFHIEYYATLREQAGVASEELVSDTLDPGKVYAQLASRHGFTLAQKDLKLAVNDAFVSWSHALSDGDRLVFIPPVSGG